MKAQADLESKNESTGGDCESCVVLEADHRKRVRESGSKRATSEVKKKSLWDVRWRKRDYMIKLKMQRNSEEKLIMTVSSNNCSCQRPESRQND